MSDLLEILRRLALQFVASDIMIQRSNLVYAHDEEEAKQLLDRYPRYDIVPIAQGDRLVAFLERGNHKPKIIQVQHVISDGTPILDLVESLSERQYVFVLGQHEVVGLIQFSDLNDPMVKLPYFVLLEGLERHVADLIRSDVKEETLQRFLDPKRLADVKKKMIGLQNENADRDLVNLLFFREILEAAVGLGLLHLKPDDLDDLSVVRNRVAHAATVEMVESFTDVRKLAKVKSICFDLLIERG